MMKELFDVTRAIVARPRFRWLREKPPKFDQKSKSWHRPKESAGFCPTSKYSVSHPPLHAKEIGAIGPYRILDTRKADRA